MVAVFCRWQKGPDMARFEDGVTAGFKLDCEPGGKVERRVGLLLVEAWWAGSTRKFASCPGR